MLYQYGLAPLGKVGFILCFILTATTSLRLARFNSFQSKFDKRFFEGLPCPAAAGFIGASIWLIEFFKIKLFFQKEIFAFIALFLSVAMISSVPFLSFKVFDRSKIPLYGFMLLVVFFSLIALHPPIALFLIFFAYIFLQPLFFLVKKIRKKPVTDSHY
jgi:CDP-diacylglycerol--serine O-phosphatidyltransferase